MIPKFERVYSHFINVVDVKAEPVSGDPFGLIANGTLTVSGKIQKALLNCHASLSTNRPGPTLTAELPENVFGSRTFPTDFQHTVLLDRPLSDNHLEVFCLLAAIGCQDSQREYNGYDDFDCKLQALILAPVPGTNRFRRLGMLETVFRPWIVRRDWYPGPNKAGNVQQEPKCVLEWLYQGELRQIDIV